MKPMKPMDRGGTCVRARGSLGRRPTESATPRFEGGVDEAMRRRLQMSPPTFGVSARPPKREDER